MRAPFHLNRFTAATDPVPLRRNPKTDRFFPILAIRKSNLAPFLDEERMDRAARSRLKGNLCSIIVISSLDNNGHWPLGWSGGHPLPLPAPQSLDSRAFIDRASRIPRLDLCYQPQLESSSRSSSLKKSSYGTVTRDGRGRIVERADNREGIE